MPIAEREGAGDFISIKQIWLKQIALCNDLFSTYPLKDSHDDLGQRAAIAAVGVLKINLIDYGDAPIKTEFLEWEQAHTNDRERNHSLGYAKLEFGAIIQILNKYQMLHDSLPRGYTNVTMESIKEVKKDE